MSEPPTVKDLATLRDELARKDADLVQLLAERAPHLVHLVEGDSYDTVFSAYVPDRETAEAVAAVLRTPNP